MPPPERHVDDLRLMEVRVLMRQREHEPQHVEHVATLALQLFDGLAALHGLGLEERFLLHAAALLHDIGWSLAKDGKRHHKLSARIIMEHPWPTIPPDMVHRMACIARYHRKSPPRAHHTLFAMLSDGDRNQVRKLAALLRIADGLDRPHLQRVRQVEARIVPEGVTLRLEVTKALKVEGGKPRK